MISKRVQQEINKTITDYLSARVRFIQVQEKYDEYLKGNDNKVGVIGEYYAFLYLENQGRDVKKVESKSQEGFDLESDGKRISVKIITRENSSGKTTKLKKGWDEFILLILDEDYSVNSIGHININQMRTAIRENKGWSETPVVKRSMINNTGLIGKYGKVESGEIINRVITDRDTG